MTVNMVAVGVEMYSRAAMLDKTALFLRINLTSSLQKKKKKKKKKKTTKKKKKEKGKERKKEEEAARTIKQ